MNSLGLNQVIASATLPAAVVLNLLHATYRVRLTLLIANDSKPAPQFAIRPRRGANRFHCPLQTEDNWRIAGEAEVLLRCC